MRYLKQKSTGNLIESQGGGNPDNPVHLQTLVDNAKNIGIAEDDIEVGYCTDEEVRKWIADEVEANKTYADKRKTEYPSIEECVHAILDDELDALQIKRQSIKKKYPKE